MTGKTAKDNSSGSGATGAMAYDRNPEAQSAGPGKQGPRHSARERAILRQARKRKKIRWR